MAWQLTTNLHVQATRYPLIYHQTTGITDSNLTEILTPKVTPSLALFATEISTLLTAPTSLNGKLII